MTTKQPKPRSEREPRRDDHDQLDGRVQTLYKVSGHYGPWSPEEHAAGSGVVEVERTPLPDPPEHLQNLAAVMDLAFVAFDEADQAWKEAAREVFAKTSGRVMVPADYSRIIDSGSGTQLRRLARAREDRWRIREEAGERLREAKVAFYAAEKTWLRSLKAAEVAS